GLAGGIFDLDSVEVARGVQGTLNGRNNTGGSISFFTKKPVLGVYEAQVSANVGTLGTWGASVIGNIPLGDDLAVRMSFNSVNRGPSGRSNQTGQGFDSVAQNS